jgi:hypothetical protein
VGKTKRGKGTKGMAVEDRSGLPIAIHSAPAAPHEVTLMEATFASRFILAAPQRLIGHRRKIERLNAWLQKFRRVLVRYHISLKTTLVCFTWLASFYFSMCF